MQGVVVPCRCVTPLSLVAETT